MSGPRIVTDYWAKPIPDRRHDWCATFDGYEPGEPIAFAQTEAEAIEALMEMAEDDHA